MLLPTAVVVAVEVKIAGKLVTRKLVDLSQGPSVVVLELEPLQTYDVTAKAFDSKDRLVFAGSMSILLSASVSGVLNLFPVATDSQGNAVAWPVLAPTVLMQPAGGALTQGVTLKAGESTSFLLDFTADATAFTFEAPTNLEVYLQKVAGGGILSLPGTNTVAKTDSPQGIWVTYFARKSDASQASLGKFTIPARSLAVSGPAVMLVNTDSPFLLSTFEPLNATDVAGNDYLWSATGALSFVNTSTSGATFKAMTTGAATITATSKRSPSVSATYTLAVTDPPVAVFDVLPAFFIDSVVLTGTADSGPTGPGIAEVWLVRDSVNSTVHDSEDPHTSGWVKATLGMQTTSTATWSTALPAVADGQWRIWAKAFDNNGKLSLAASHIDLTVDTTPPVLTEATVGIPSQTLTGPWTFGGNASDATSGLASLTVTVDGVSSVVPVTAGAWSLPVALMPSDGSRTYSFVAADQAGKTSTLTRTIIVDTTAPLLTETTVAVPSKTVAGPFTFGGNASDATAGLASLTVAVDAGAPTAVTVTAGAWTVTPTLPSDGSHTYTFVATDQVGKTSTLTRTVIVDTTAPLLTETTVAVPSKSVSGAFTFGGNASDGTSGLASLTVTVDGGAPTAVTVTAGAWTVTPTLPSDGSHTYTLVATDQVGKTSTLTRTIIVDTTAPLLTETTVAVPSKSVSGAFTFGGNASDATSGLASLTVAVDAGAPTAVTVTAGAWTVTPTLPSDGSHTYTFVATDQVGKTSTLTRTIIVDTTAPSLTVVSPTNLATVVDTKLTLSGTSDDTTSSVSSVDFSLDGGSWTTASGTASWSVLLSGLTDGVHTLLVRAVDSLGNASTTTSRTVTVKNTVDVTFAISGYQKLTFSTPSLVITATSQPLIATSDTLLREGGASWKWWVDGVLRGSAASFLLPSNVPVGFHTVSVFVTYTENGASVDYSQSFDLTVTP